MQCTVRTILGLIALVTLLGGCASPDWSGMSNSQISDWQSAGAGPAVAQDWEKKGFDAQEYTVWIAAGFDLDSAAKWEEKKFTAAEATQWEKSGFDLKKATRSRDEGLEPITGAATDASSDAPKSASDAIDAGK
jgi:hypothetical protein